MCVVSDIPGNIYSFMFDLMVLSLDHDSDGDGIPDLVEMDWGLSPDDPSDASLDPDNDNLTNLQEYLNGTDINDPDTDGDGMPDGWEVKYGFDPTRFSGIIDSDQDGKTDIEEYYTGSNPMVKDKVAEPDGEKSPIWIIIVASIIVLIFLLLLISQSFKVSKMKQRVEEVGVLEKNIKEGNPDQESLPEAEKVENREALPESSWKAARTDPIEQGISGMDIPTIEEDLMMNPYGDPSVQLPGEEGTSEEEMDYQRPERKYPLYML